ncbi:hypothetical protein ACC689_17620 [Rhizobium ruizarguesonis]
MLDLQRLPELSKVSLEGLLKDWGVVAFSARTELSGKSGAHVWLVDVQSKTYNGLAILKFGEVELLSKELRSHQEALKNLPSNSIPSIVHASIGEPIAAFLMSVAADGMLEVEPMSALPHSKLGTALSATSEGILTGWNKDAKFETQSMSCADLLNALAFKQLAPGSRIPSFMFDYARLRIGTTCFRYLNCDYPNPLALISEASRLTQIKLTAIKGASHGDLHPGNILMSRYSTPPFANIIDFEKFNSDQYLLFDNAYLELSLLLNGRSDVTNQRWIEICLFSQAIERETDAYNAPNSDDVGLLYNIGCLRANVASWIKGKFPHRKEDIKKQILVTRIAAGLDFCNKRTLSETTEVSNKKKFLAFMYAAVAAKSLFEYCSISVPQDGANIVVHGDQPLPKGDSWRKLWDACGGFDPTKASYILVADNLFGRASDFSIKTLMRLPWSAVIDLDGAGVDSRLATVGLPEIRKVRSTVQLLPHQLSGGEIASSVCWLVANAAAESTPIGNGPTLSAWRTQTLKSIRRLGEQIFHASTPRRIKLIMISSGTDIVRMRAVLTSLQEASGSLLEVIVVTEPDGAAVYDALREEVERGQGISCDIQEFALGTHQLIGEPVEKRSSWLPMRDENGEVRLSPLTDEAISLYNDIGEIVPSSPSNLQENSEELFLKGGVVSWSDLDLHRDVDRDVTREVVQRLRRRLASSPNESFAIDHTPGAGGSTVARRIAWELRDEFPAIVLRSFTAQAIEVLDMAFRQTNLPLLIVVEATRVSAGQRDILYRELRTRNVRFLLLDVRRQNSPRDTETSVAVSDPMTFNEAQRFFRVFSGRAPLDRTEPLRDLATKRELQAYRSPFFFGLYAFERGFVKIPEFVDACLQEASERVRDAIKQLALITRYSQERLPLAAFNTLIQLKADATIADIEALFGPGPMRLIIGDEVALGIKHPILAEEILRKELQPAGNTNPDAWRGPLPDFCIEFVDRIAALGLAESNDVLEILYDLFVERQSSTGLTRTRFSELLEELRSEYGEKRVLEKLTEAFPENAYFLSHLARNINYRQSGTFEEAESAALRAIRLDEFGDDHYHVLGMIYRFEIERRLQVDRRSFSDIESIVSSIQDVFDKAVGAFKSSYELAPGSQFPLITPIQMTLHTLERLFSISGAKNFVAFLGGNNAAAFWCRSKLDYSLDLFDELHRSEAAGEPSERRVKCDADLEMLLGHTEQVILSLSALLKRPDVRKGPIRRMIVNAYLSKTEVSAAEEIPKLRRSASLSEENLREDPASLRDLRSWLRAYRMLPDASISVAIEKFARASLLTDDVEAHYYLMILNFIAHRQGVPGSLQAAKKSADLCRQRSATILGKRSFEWLGDERLGRAIPLVHHSELGRWSPAIDFFENSAKLAIMDGRIDEVRSFQSGTIMFSGMPAFFAPRADFRRIVDTNASVIGSIGFSYEGLRAWNVKKNAKIS